MTATEHDGLLIVVSGPSGVGKGTICKELIRRNPDVKLSVSATTRTKRAGEEEGISYFFVTTEQFESMIANGELIEYARLFNNNYYGTPRSFVEQEIAQGNDILLEIDYHGALHVKEVYPDAVLVFVAPPELSALKDRLIARHSESADSMEERLSIALKEISKIQLYDYVVVNDSVDNAVEAFESILKAEKQRVCRNLKLLDSFKEA